MNKVRKWFEDQILAALQRRCTHPSTMVAADILEGGVKGLEVKYCRRYGAIKTDWAPQARNLRLIALPHYWRQPNPNLWRGR